MKSRKIITSLAIALCMAFLCSSITGCDSLKKGSGKKHSDSRSEDEDKKSGKKVPEVSPFEFTEAVKDAYGCTSYDFEEKDSTQIYIEDLEMMYNYIGDKGDIYYATYYLLESEESAKAFYQVRADNYIDFNEIDGEFYTFDDYLFIDADLEPNYDQEDYYIFGGVYRSGRSVMEICCFSDNNENKDVIKNLMEDLELPLPKKFIFK
ncbi:MAG: hypothetical protein J6U23_05785 [Clostridiales bacterium]|nr:hypothetical protein [Clostridiales bacterium]